ncbi:MAG TPA: lipopolysaccharide biosynthesis protein [Anaerolineales bacterium]
MLSGMTWQYVSIFAQAVLNLFVLGTLSRLLAPADFGVMGIAAIFVGLAELFSELGVGPAIIQHRELSPKHARVGFTIAVLLGIILVGIMWSAAPLVAIFFKNSGVTPVLRGVSFDFLLGSFGVVSEGLLRRKLKFRKLMWINVAAYAFGYALVGIAMAYGGYAVWALVGATLSQSLLKSIMLLVVEPHSMKPSFSRTEFRELVHFGGGITLARLFNYAAGQGDYFVVGRTMGAGPLGIYTRAYRLMLLPSTYLGRALDNVLFPVMAKIQDQLARLSRTYLTGIALIGLTCAPLETIMIILAPEIVSVVLGPNWADTIIPFQILAFGILPRVSYKIDNSLARATGSVYQRSIRDAIYAVTVVLGAWSGLRWGLQGVATGVLIAVVLNDVMAIRMSLGILKSSWVEYAKTQTAGLVLSGVILAAGLPTRTLLRSAGLPDWVVLIGSLFVCSVFIAAVFLWQPNRILGIYGTDALGIVFRSIPGRLVPGPVLRWYQARIAEAAP